MKNNKTIRSFGTFLGSFSMTPLIACKGCYDLASTPYMYTNILINFVILTNFHVEDAVLPLSEMVNNYNPQNLESTFSKIGASYQKYVYKPIKVDYPPRKILDFAIELRDNWNICKYGTEKLHILKHGDVDWNSPLISSFHIGPTFLAEQKVLSTHCIFKVFF